MGNRSAFILVPETLESHGILGNGRPAVPGQASAGIGQCRVPVPRAPWLRAAYRRERSLRLHRHAERAAPLAPRSCY